MANIKLTKNEQKKQKDALKRFTRYLPTLMLKKQQLQLVIRGLEADVKAKQDERKVLEGEIQSWVDVFGEEVEFDKLVRIKYLETEEGNIAGVDIPVFKGIEFEQIEYDLFRQQEDRCLPWRPADCSRCKRKDIKEETGKGSIIWQ